jgi:PAS domain S-box-containing protein
MPRILIVDELADDRLGLAALLKGHGHEVDEARDGEEALSSARLAPPDLVVSALSMPVMDGVTLLRHWKNDEQLKPIPFMVYAAAATDAQDERLVLSLGADAFVIRPADPGDLLRRVGALLAASAHGASATEEERTDSDPGPPGKGNEVPARALEQSADELEQANRELSESEERFRTTFEQAAVGLAHVGLDLHLLRVNDKLCEVMCYTREELLGMRVTELNAPEFRQEVEDAFAAMIAGTRSNYATEKRYQRKDGEQFWVQAVTTLARDPEGRPRYFISVISDVSERRMLQDQLHQAQKLDAIGQLTGGIAHDFNNLLTVILGNTDLLVEGLADQPVLRSYAEVARTAASHGADLTQRMLAFARRQALDPRSVDVAELLGSMETLLRRTLPAHIEMTFIRDATPWQALVDPVQLEAAILNLCINARDAMPDGGRLTIETSKVYLDAAQTTKPMEVKAGEYVLVAVSDTGSGIAPEHLSKVFDPFFSTKPAGNGTGLGLSMVYGLVKQSNGQVSIYSELGQGTTVKLYLPRAGAADQAFVAEEAVRLEDLSGTEHILLVEDDELVRQYAEEQLRRLGYRVVTATDGASALQVVQARDDLDLLFTDIVMPGGMNGRVLAERALSIRPQLKVLFSSGYTENAIVHHGRLDPGVHLLNKPYSRLELARKLRTVLAATGASAARLPGPGRLLVLDDDPLVGKVLGTTAERLGFAVELKSRPQDFFESIPRWQPSHLVIDLSMPELSGLQVLGRLAELGCTARIIISSGTSMDEIQAALQHARDLQLPVAGALPKPFTVAALRNLLGTEVRERPKE